jgi:hypothetical protein
MQRPEVPALPRAVARALACATGLVALHAASLDFGWPRHEPLAATNQRTPHGAKPPASATARAAPSATAKAASSASAKAASAPASTPASAAWNGTVLRVARLSAGGSQTLQDAVRTFGPAPFERSPEAASEAGAASAPTPSSALCYDIAEPRGRFSLRFYSDGEKAEPAGQITALTVTQLTPEDAGWQNCRRQARRTSGVVDRRGLTLGMPQAAIHRLLGPPRASGEGADDFSACTRRYFERRSSAYSKWAGKAACFENAAKPYANDCTAVHVEYRDGTASLISVGVNSSVC